MDRATEEAMMDKMMDGTPVYYIGYPRSLCDDASTPVVLTGTVCEIRTERGWQIFKARDEYGKISHELTVYQLFFDKQKALRELKSQLESAVTRFQKRLTEIETELLS